MTERSSIGGLQVNSTTADGYYVGETKNGGRRLSSGGYLVGQLNPQLHHPPYVPTTQEVMTDSALDAIGRVLNLIGSDKSFTKAQQSKIIGAFNGVENS